MKGIIENNAKPKTNFKQEVLERERDRKVCARFKGEFYINRYQRIFGNLYLFLLVIILGLDLQSDF